MADELTPDELAQVDTTIPEADLESFDPEANTARYAVDTPEDIEGSYTATRQVTEEMDAVDELEAEFGAELDAEEDAREPAPEPATKPTTKPEEDGGVDVGAILSDIGRGIIELPVQTVGGVRDAAQETMEAIERTTEAIGHRTHLDSLYRTHLEGCSFIDDENIKIGRNGILYSKYHKEGKVINIILF